MKLKDNCWRIVGKTDSYFLKKYKHAKTYEKVRVIYEQLQPKVPVIAPAISFHEPFIVYKWLDCRVANYSDVADCRHVWEMLSQIHEHGQKCCDDVPRLQLEAKWHYRLLQFEYLLEDAQPAVQRYFQDVVRVAKFTLERASFPKGDLTLLHGDVAHHNFLLSTKANYIIDLDLAVAGTVAEEAVLFMHRLLPHFHYNVLAVLQAVPALEAYKAYFPLLLFPNELMREWLFFYDEPLMHRYLTAMTAIAIERWPLLYEQIQRLD